MASVCGLRWHYWVGAVNVWMSHCFPCSPYLPIVWLPHSLLTVSYCLSPFSFSAFKLSISLPPLYLSFLLPLFFLITLWFLSYTLPLILTLPLSPSHCLSLNHKGRTEPSVRLMNKVLQAQRSMFCWVTIRPHTHILQCRLLCTLKSNSTRSTLSCALTSRDSSELS